MPKNSSVKALKIVRVEGTQASTRDDLVVAEEPLEIRLGYGPAGARLQKSISITMRTAGHDFELSLGFLFGEGIISRYEDVHQIAYCTNVAHPEEVGNVVKIELAESIRPEIAKLDRHFYTTSSCGVCGKASIEALENQACTVFPTDIPPWSAAAIHTLPDQARAAQTTFRHTGGIHAATLFDRAGCVLLSREDVGRHNAVDKVVGAMLMSGKLPGTDYLLLVSGRAGFELVQKTVVAGIPVMAAVGAPSGLAVDLAREYDLSLLGFVRNGRFNIYSGAERIALS